MKLLLLLEANEDAWKKDYSARIILDWRINDSGLDKNAVNQAHEEAQKKFSKLKSSHPTKLQFKSVDEAAKYMKKMGYPGWPMHVERAHWRYGDKSFTRKEKLVLKKQDFVAPFKVDDFKVEEVEGGFKVSTQEKAGPKLNVMINLGGKFVDKKGFEVRNSLGKKYADWRAIYSARPRALIIKGVEKERLEKEIDDAVKRELKHHKSQHDRKQDAPERKREDAKASAAYQKERKQELYNKYGKDIVERVKIKSMSHEGDDGYQWALFLDGRRKQSGMTQSQAYGEQRMMWSYLKKFEDMTPEEKMKEAQVAAGIKAYFALGILEKSIKSQLPKYLDAISKNAKEFVDSKDKTDDAIKNAKELPDDKAKKVLDDLMSRLRKKAHD